MIPTLDLEYHGCLYRYIIELTNIANKIVGEFNEKSVILSCEAALNHLNLEYVSNKLITYQEYRIIKSQDYSQDYVLEYIPNNELCKISASWGRPQLLQSDIFKMANSIIANHGKKDYYGRLIYSDIIMTITKEDDLLVIERNKLPFNWLDCINPVIYFRGDDMFRYHSEFNVIAGHMLCVYNRAL